VILSGCGRQTVNPTQISGNQQSKQVPEMSGENGKTAVSSTTTDSVAPPELNWTDFPFMKSTDSVVAVMSPANLAKSPSISRLIASLPLEDVSLTIPPSETKWVAVYMNPLVNADNSLTRDATMVIKLNRPSSTFEIAESRFANADLCEVSHDDYQYLRVSGLTKHRIETITDIHGYSREVINFDTAVEMAVFEYDESTYMICEEARLPHVLSLQDADSDLRSLVAGTKSKSPLFFATSIKDRTTLKEALARHAAEIQEGGVLQVLAANADQIILTLDTDNQELLHMSVQTTDSDQATELNTAIQTFVESGSQFLMEMTFLETPQTAPVFSLAGDLLSGLSTTTVDSTVSVTVVNPGNLPEAFSALEALFEMEVTSAGTP
jgi:hypothetical protein